jgi:hypothetical protein
MIYWEVLDDWTVNEIFFGCAMKLSITWNRLVIRENSAKFLAETMVVIKKNYFIILLCQFIKGCVVYKLVALQYRSAIKA